ncbi:MAG TPA: 3-deoxy-manno-octulosonate-8-phosphatase KdsC [Candidatus Competibacteraceae bacterium]|nr:3-deoxy-manno-octulosonate-8-phosphatase KdsC [Candidatus Competibacteraceae bacterium]
MRLASEDLYRRAAAVRLLVLDVDGVLTDGRLYYGDDGHEYKAFHIRDGHGIKMLQAQGVPVAVISGRRAASVERRLGELGVAHAWLGTENKDEAFAELLARLGLAAEQVAYVGDDLIDLPVMSRVGLAIAVADADPFVVEHAHWRTARPGGLGAVREVCELILAAQGRLGVERTRYLAANR